MPASVLFILSAGRITPEMKCLAEARGITLDSVIERLAAPDSASLQTRVLTNERATRNRTSKKKPLPILDVQLAWRWQKLTITIDPVGSLTAQYGRQRHMHQFTKANRTGVSRHAEILMRMAVDGVWQPSRAHHDADSKAFKRLEAELRALLPISGNPFEQEGPEYRPMFDLILPKEHWRAGSNDASYEPDGADEENP